MGAVGVLAGGYLKILMLFLEGVQVRNVLLLAVQHGPLAGMLLTKSLDVGLDSPARCVATTL